MAKRTPELTPTEARRRAKPRINVRVLLGLLTLALVAGVVLYATSVPAPDAGKTVQQPGETR
jgi:hypothetical protein